jgi:hypothetical protein
VAEESSAITISESSRVLFELLPGTIVDVQLNYPVTARIKTPLVGYVLGRYILLKYPSEQKYGNYRDVLIEGNVAIVRYLLEGQHGKCFAFRATISYITQYPEKLIVLTYPEKIENRQLRVQQRITTHLPATITLTNEDLTKGDVKISGIISDISTKGCGFAFKTDKANVKVNKREIYVCIAVGDGNEIKILAQVCNSRYQQGKINVGIQFKAGDEQVKEVLEKLLIDPNAL